MLFLQKKYVPDNLMVVLRLVWNLTVVDLSIIAGITLLDIFGGCYIYTDFIPGYFSVNLAGNLQYYF